MDSLDEVGVAREGLQRGGLSSTFALLSLAPEYEGWEVGSFMVK